jgi:hypothetical protein
VSADERAAPGDHLVEHRAEREDVGAMIQFTSARLLRRKIRDGADHQPRRGLRAAGGESSRGNSRLRAGREDPPHEAEVQDLQPAVGGQEDVVGRQVAMDDAALVGCGQALRHGNPVLDRSCGIQRAVNQTCTQRHAVEQLHHGVGRVALVAELEDRDDVRMRERRDGQGFTLEARERLRVGRCGRRQHLDGDIAMEPEVARPIDFAHAPRPQGANDLECPQAGSCRQRHDGRDYIGRPEAGRD